MQTSEEDIISSFLNPEIFRNEISPPSSPNFSLGSDDFVIDGLNEFSLPDSPLSDYSSEAGLSPSDLIIDAKPAVGVNFVPKPPKSPLPQVVPSNSPTHSPSKSCAVPLNPCSKNNPFPLNKLLEVGASLSSSSIAAPSSSVSVVSSAVSQLADLPIPSLTPLPRLPLQPPPVKGNGTLPQPLPQLPAPTFIGMKPTPSKFDQLPKLKASDFSKISCQAPTPLKTEDNKDPLSKKRKLLCQDTHPVILPAPKKPVILPSEPSKPPPEMDDYTKRQLRLIKNREAASLSRQRRKDHVRCLETQVEKLQRENEELKKKVETLENRNNELTQRYQSTGTSKNGLKAAGVVVMVVFFSFAVFLNPISIKYGEGMELSTLQESAVHVGSRSLQSISDKVSEELQLATASASLSSASASVSSSTTPSRTVKNQLDDIPPDSLIEGQLFLNETVQGDIPFDGFEDSHTRVETNDLKYWLDQSLTTNLEKSLSMSHGNPNTAPQRRPDVAYMFCSEVFQILPNEKAHHGKPKLSLLVPSSSSWEGSEPDTNHDHILQIDCEVLGTHALPLPKTKTTAGHTTHDSHSHGNSTKRIKIETNSTVGM